MIDWPNVTASSQQAAGLKPEELQRSKCVLGFIPVVYYSILLCVGVPGMLHPNQTQRGPAITVKQHDNCLLLHTVLNTGFKHQGTRFKSFL